MINSNTKNIYTQCLKLFNESKFDEFIQIFEKHKAKLIKIDPNFVAYFINALCKTGNKKLYTKIIKIFEKYEDIITSNVETIMNYMIFLIKQDTLESINKAIDIFEKYKEVTSKNHDCIEYYNY